MNLVYCLFLVGFLSHRFNLITSYRMVCNKGFTRSNKKELQFELSLLSKGEKQSSNVISEIHNVDNVPITLLQQFYQSANFLMRASLVGMFTGFGVVLFKSAIAATSGFIIN